MKADLAKRCPLQTCKPYLWSLVACALCVYKGTTFVFFSKIDRDAVSCEKKKSKGPQNEIFNFYLNHCWWNVTNSNSLKCCTFHFTFYFAWVFISFYYFILSLHSSLEADIALFFFKYIILCYWAFICNQLRVLTEQSRERERNQRQHSALLDPIYFTSNKSDKEKKS